jgi:hypothetical protein
MMIAMAIGGTTPISLISNFSILARNGSSSKRLMMMATWPPLKIEVWATAHVYQLSYNHESAWGVLTWNASCVEHWKAKKLSLLKICQK